MKRSLTVMGNWKMNGTAREAAGLADAVRERLRHEFAEQDILRRWKLKHPTQYLAAAGSAAARHVPPCRKRRRTGG